MDDRRRSGVREVSDRRVIDRFSNPRVEASLAQIRWLMRLFMGSLGLAALLEVVWFVLHRGGASLDTVLIVGFVGGVMLVMGFRLHEALGWYLQNLSITNFETVLERAVGYFTALTIFGFLFLVFSLILRWDL